MWISGGLQPVDIRVPGYPAFLSLVAAVGGSGHWPRSVTIAQGLLDVLGCFVIAAVAAELAPRESRQRVWMAGLWLAALCPFVANYAAALLTEVPATFLTALGLLVMLRPGGMVALPDGGDPATVRRTAVVLGLVAGCGALFRPETPLLVAAAGIVLAIRCRRPRHWGILLRTGALVAVGLMIPLAPWAARNWVTLHKVQPLNPRNTELPGEIVPRGLEQWTDTWLWRFRDVYLVNWKVDEEPILLGDMPPAAFDSAKERDRVGQLLDEYNHVDTMTPEVDAGFAELAQVRTRLDPFRTYAKIPALRALAMWFTPRIELLPFSGDLWPVRDSWENDPVDFSVTLALGAINVFFLMLAIAGAWEARRAPGMAFLAAFILLRTAFFARVETPEPRYMLECYPAVLALAAQAWQKRSGDGSPAKCAR